MIDCTNLYDWAMWVGVANNVAMLALQVAGVAFLIKKIRQ